MSNYPVTYGLRIASSEIFGTALAVLNEALAADPEAISNLMSQRQSCNLALADHPTVQVDGGMAPPFSVGALGLINGIVEPLTGKRIASVTDSDAPTRILGFIEYSPAP